jgi:hypothetical protein
MSWVLLIIWLVALILLLTKLPIVKDSRLKFQFILLIFFSKIIVGFGLVHIYTNYYSDRGAADIYKFYDDAAVIASALPDNPIHYFKLVSGLYDNEAELKIYTDSMNNWMPQSSEWLEFTQTRNYNIFQSNRIITRINALLIPITAGNIFTLVIIFCWISLLGLLLFVKLFHESTSVLSYWIILLFPSLLLWCSGPMKDTLTLLAICLIFYFAAGNKYKALPMHSIVWILFGIILLLLTKYYVAIAFVPAFIIIAIQRKWSLIARFKGTLLIFLGISLVISALIFLPYLIDVLNGKREEALKAAIFGEAKHLLFINLIDHGLEGFLIEIPKAIYTTLFRPMIWEAQDSFLVLLSSLENLFLLILILVSIFVQGKAILKSTNFYPMLAFVLSLALIIGYTTPVAGGLVRYKTALLLPLLFICVSEINSKNSFHNTYFGKLLNEFTLKK